MHRFDLAAVRAAFPSLARDFVFMDNAGGSQCLGAVADAVRSYLLECNVQLGASYSVSEEASMRVLEGRRSIARLVGADDDRQVVLGSSTTQLLSNLAMSMSAGLRPGDEVIVTNADHEANIGPFRRLESRGVVVREWKIDLDTLRLNASDLDPLLGPRTRLVCMTHCSNVIGHIHDVREIADRVHAAGARVLIDGVAFAPHRRVQMGDIGADYYVFSLYKVYGPHVAALIAPLSHLEELGNINHAFLADEIPYKLQPGNVCYELVSALPAIERYLLDLGGGAGEGSTEDALKRGFAAIASQEADLGERLLAFLRTRRDLTILGDSDSTPTRRVPTISFVPRHHSPAALVRRVDARRIGIRHGHFYAQRLVEALGNARRGGVVRVSLVHYNSAEEVDRLIEALEEALASERD